MTIEPELRELLEAKGASMHVDGLLSATELTDRAVIRTRRSRLMGGLATVLIGAVMVIGVGTALREPDPNAVFAGTDGVGLAPVTAVYTGDEFVGVAPADNPADLITTERQYVFVRSSDGETWKLADEIPAFAAIAVNQTYHGGVHHVISTRANAAGDGHDLVHLTTQNLSDFEVAIQPFPNESDARGLTPWLVDAVAADAGVIVATRQIPDWISASNATLTAAGIDVEDVCDATYDSTRLDYRLCGETAFETLKVDPPLDQSPVKEMVLFAPVGEDFAEATLPEQDLERQRSEGFGNNSVYATANGFGVVGVETFESNDGIAWARVDTGNDVGPMVAVRGEERVFRTTNHVARFGDDDPLVGQAYSGDGQTWEPVDVSDAYENVDGPPRFYTDLQVGPAGWTITAQRRLGLTPPVPGVERDRVVTKYEFVATAGGYELAGTSPFGPATLTDPEGVVVRKWQQLELRRPDLSDFVTSEAGVHLEDPVTGKVIVGFTLQQWQAMAAPHWEEGNAFDVLFSPNGRDWSIVSTAGTPQRVLAITEDTILVGQFHNFLAESYSLVEIVDVPDEPTE